MGFMWQSLQSQGMTLQIIWESVVQWKLTNVVNEVKYMKFWAFRKVSLEENCMNVVDVVKFWFLYSDLTDPQVINVNWNLMHVVHVVSLLEGVQFFTKHEKIPTGKNPYIQSTINPSSGRNHMSVARISVMGNHSLHQENSLFLQVPFRPKDIRWCILKRPSKCYQCGQAFCLHLKLLENIHTR